jgi:hypothetical protein
LHSRALELTVLGGLEESPVIVYILCSVIS